MLGPGGAWWRHPPGTATAVGGTHPTGMHSCLVWQLEEMLFFFWFKRVKLYSSQGNDRYSLNVKTQALSSRCIEQTCV